MSVARTHTAQPSVLRGEQVTVEADLSRGLHAFTIVGLAGKAVEESKDRVSAAIKNSGFTAPKSTNQKITISLSPADLKKEGPLFDLPIAIAYLIAAGHIKTAVEDTILVGELGLDGTLQPVRGVLSVVEEAKRNGFTSIIIPKLNAEEAALIPDIAVLPADSLGEVIRHLDSSRQDHTPLMVQPATQITHTWSDTAVRLEDIKGQESAKRGLMIAAAGGHNVLMVGPPGTGKTMLARAFASLLPPLSVKEALAVTAIHSLTGELSNISTEPPFRAPHHTASHTALVGGGTHPRPGEVTLAHHGVLFMDEFPEFERRSLDALRQPLEDKVVSISRVQGTAHFPADFILIAAMNPYRGSEDGTSDYVGAIKDTYRGKVSGPILDRIDLWLEVPHVDYDTLTAKQELDTNETTDARNAIEVARAKQTARHQKGDPKLNARMSSRDIETLVPLSREVQDLLRTSSEKLNLSPRSYHRLIKVAQTIADLEQSNQIKTEHVLEGLQYRVKL